jgi:eukaryotic-like serine/threonine-protein kinase
VEDHGPSLVGALLEQRYRVDALLARGGMSAVYRGLDTRLDRPVAIKVMDPRFSADQAFVERFEREARSAAKIHHPNVVAVHDQGLDGDHVFLVMELVDGGTLRDLLSERGALGVPLALSIMEPVLAALAAAHQAGLVHRDVKPENVLIGTNGTVKVADFGLVRAIASVGTTSSSVILGTVAYLSPEQVTTGTATARGDVYSSGILLYEMLTGAPPYVGDTAISIAYRHVNDDVPAPHSGLVPVDELATMATRRDPASRPLDAGAFLLDLQRIRATAAIPRVPVPVPRQHLVDRTMPVSAEEKARAIGLDLPPGDPEATLVPVSNATTVRQVPSGFQAMGPQGTKAWLRADIGPPPMSQSPAPLLTAPPPSPPYGNRPPYPPTGGQPVQPPARPPRKRTNRIVLWSILSVLLVAVVGTATWWFAAGRWTSVPSVGGHDRASAERQLTDADIHPQVVSVRDNAIASGTVIRTDPGPGAHVLRGDTVKLIISLGRPTVPDVPAGITVEEAERAVVAADLRPERDDGKREFSDTVPKGTVIRLDPKAGTQLSLKAPVTIVVSKGQKPKPIPDLRGKSRDDAFGALHDAGYEPFDGPKEFAADVDGGKVIRTDPPAGTERKDDTSSNRVAVIVSNAVTVPDVSRQAVDAAKTALEALHLTVEVQQFGQADGGRVFSQSVRGGDRVQEGTKVILFVFPGF